MLAVLVAGIADALTVVESEPEDASAGLSDGCDPLATLGSEFWSEAFDEEEVCGRHLIPEGLSGFRTNADLVMDTARKGGCHCTMVETEEDTWSSQPPCYFEWGDEMQPGTPARGRHVLSPLGDAEISMPSLTLYDGTYSAGYSTRGKVWEWSSTGWWRPVIRIEFLPGAYEEWAEPEVVKAMRYALDRIPNLVLYSLPPRVTLKLAGEDSLGGAAALAVGTSESAWSPFDPEFAVLMEPRVVVDFVGSDSLVKDRRLEEVLIHEFAHILDFHHDVTSGDAYGDWWQARHDERAGWWEFVTRHAERNVRENFAETLLAWTALHSGRLDYRLHRVRRKHMDGTEEAIPAWYGEACTTQDYIPFKAPLEMEWWSARAREAALSASGRLFTR